VGGRQKLTLDLGLHKPTQQRIQRGKEIDERGQSTGPHVLVAWPSASGGWKQLKGITLY
jgi:hypothetical protein